MADHTRHEDRPGYLGENYPADPDMSLYKVDGMEAIFLKLRAAHKMFGSKIRPGYPIVSVSTDYVARKPVSLSRPLASPTPK